MHGNLILSLIYVCVKNIILKLLMSVSNAQLDAVAVLLKLSAWHVIKINIGFLITTVLSVSVRMAGLEWIDIVLLVQLAAWNALHLKTARFATSTRTLCHLITAVYAQVDTTKKMKTAGAVQWCETVWNVPLQILALNATTT